MSTPSIKTKNVIKNHKKELKETKLKIEIELLENSINIIIIKLKEFISSNFL